MNFWTDVAQPKDQMEYTGIYWNIGIQGNDLMLLYDIICISIQVWFVSISGRTRTCSKHPETWSGISVKRYYEHLSKNQGGADRCVSTCSKWSVQTAAGWWFQILFYFPDGVRILEDTRSSYFWVALKAPIIKVPPKQEGLTNDYPLIFESLLDSFQSRLCVLGGRPLTTWGCPMDALESKKAGVV